LNRRHREQHVAEQVEPQHQDLAHFVRLEARIGPPQGGDPPPQADNAEQDPQHGLDKVDDRILDGPIKASHATPFKAVSRQLSAISMSRLPAKRLPVDYKDSPHYPRALAVGAVTPG